RSSARRRPHAMDRAGDAVVVLGEILGSYGVRGWLKVRPYTDAADALLGYENWWLKPAGAANWRKVRRLGGRMHSGLLVVELDGIGSPEMAKALKGADVGVPREALPPPSGREVYWEDL